MTVFKETGFSVFFIGMRGESPIFLTFKDSIKNRKTHKKPIK